VELVKYLTT